MIIYFHYCYYREKTNSWDIAHGRERRDHLASPQRDADRRGRSQQSAELPDQHARDERLHFHASGSFNIIR